MKEIKHFDGLYGDLNHKPRHNYIFSELLETRSKSFDWTIQPHFHAHLFQVFCIETGTLRFQTDTFNKEITVPCVIVIPPNVLHGFSYTADAKGRILSVADTVSERIFSDLPNIGIALGKLQCISDFPENDIFFLEIMSLIVKIDEELFSERTEKSAMLQIYFSQLFIVLFRLLRTDANEIFSETNQALKYFRQFQILIKTSEYPKTIPEFAATLNISPVHLNRICQSVTNKSASELVKVHLINEAQKYLTYTAYSVSEIAYLLKFEYPNYFAKLFKKHTGMTPKEFREKEV